MAMGVVGIPGQGVLTTSDRYSVYHRHTRARVTVI